MTRLRRVGIFSDHSIRQSLLSLQVNNFESGQYLAKLWARVECSAFLIHGVHETIHTAGRVPVHSISHYLLGLVRLELYSVHYWDSV